MENLQRELGGSVHVKKLVKKPKTDKKRKLETRDDGTEAPPR